MPVIIELFCFESNDLFYLSINGKRLEINYVEFIHLKEVFDLYEEFGKFIEEKEVEGI